MKRTLILLIAAIMNYGPSALAIPQQINYQGYLTRPDGSPLDTTVAMTFKLWNADGSIDFWTETHPSVTVTGGVFDVRLGQYTPITDAMFYLSTVLLGVTVGNDAEMTPRERIVSVAYAYRVGTVDGASGGTITGKLNVGWNNTNTGDSAFVAGLNNTADGDYGTVSGGYFNFAAGNFSTVSGGLMNAAGFYGTTVSGGHGNNAGSMYSTVGGGFTNTAGGYGATVSGGSHNTASGDSSFIGGGQGNTVGDYESVIGGGSYNTVMEQRSVIGGGRNNTIGAAYCVIGGGLGNSASQPYATIGGGSDNLAGDDYATVPGGYRNQANGSFSFAAGDSAIVSGANSFALGTRINCLADSAFVWSDGTGGVTGIGSSRTFSVKATAGTRIWTNSAVTSGVRIGAGENAWTSVSDSTKKRNIRGLDTNDILSRFSSLPLKRWEYKSEDNGVEHVGPMAQDFWSAFHLGNDPLGISTIDADGVMMAAIQELAKRLDALESENAVLGERIRTIETNGQ